MKKTVNKALSLLLSFALCLSLLAFGAPALAADVVASGSCSSSGSVTWSLDSAGNMTISGIGAMEYGYEQTYQDHAKLIRNLVVEDGVTSIGYNAFNGCGNLGSAEIADSVTSIESYAFANCHSLKSVRLPEGLTALAFSTFSSCTSLDHVDVPASVTSIGFYAFSDCTSLTDLTLRPGLTTIEALAFYNCSSLPELNIPNTVTTLGSSIISGCSSLTSITIPASVTTIDDMSSSTGLEEYIVDEANPAYCSVDGVLYSKDMTVLMSYPSAKSGAVFEIPESVKIINSSAFSGSQLEQIKIPDGVTSIGNSAFASCIKLKELDLPAGLTEIGTMLCWLDMALTRVSIPDGVTRIGESAFSVCPLEELTLPAALEEIGENAFQSCAFPEVELPASLTVIGKDAFSDNARLASIRVAAGNPAFSAVDGVLLSADGTELISYPAYRPGASYSVPESVTFIRSGAFNKVQYLEELALPAGVETIESNTLNNALKLRSIRVSADNPNYSVIDGVLFSKDGTVLLAYPAGKGAEYAVPTGTKSIGDNAFSYNTLLKKVTFPAGLEKIGQYAFYACSALPEVRIPDTVTEIAMSAFGYTGIKQVQLPPGLTTVDGFMFTGLTDVVIPEGATAIAMMAFWYCTALTSVTIPRSMTEIGFMAFSGCTALTDIYYGGSILDWNIISIGSSDEPLLGATVHTTDVSGTCGDGLRWYLFDDGTLLIEGTGSMGEGSVTLSALGGSDSPFAGYEDRIKRVVIGLGVTDICDSAFENCTNLESVSIPDSVGSIGQNAFLGCTALEEVTVPESVTEIGGSAFEGCAALESITFDGDAPEIGADALPENTTIYYHNTKNGWQDSGWDDRDMVPLDAVPGDANGDGTLDSKDAIYLARSIAKWDGYTVDLAVCDLNGDGQVNSKDSIILARHIAKWTGYETIPLPAK